MTRRRPGEQFWNADTTSQFLSNSSYFEDSVPHVVKQLLDGYQEDASLGRGLSALGGVVSYLKELYLDKEILSQGRFQQYSGVTYDSPNLVLDSKTIKNLELFENTVDGKVRTFPILTAQSFTSNRTTVAI